METSIQSWRDQISFLFGRRSRWQKPISRKNVLFRGQRSRLMAHPSKQGNIDIYAHASPILSPMVITRLLSKRQVELSELHEVFFFRNPNRNLRLENLIHKAVGLAQHSNFEQKRTYHYPPSLTQWTEWPRLPCMTTDITRNVLCGAYS